MNGVWALLIGLGLLAYWMLEFARGEPQRIKGVGAAIAGTICAVALIAIGAVMMAMDLPR